MSDNFLKIINEDNTDNYHLLTKSETLNLELKLNVTKYGKKWSNIGDMLFNFQAYSNKDMELFVTKEQFLFFNVLLSKESWNQCMNL